MATRSRRTAPMPVQVQPEAKEAKEAKEEKTEKKDKPQQFDIRVYGGKGKKK